MGSNQAYTYVGLYVTMPEGAVSLKQNFEGDPENMDDVAADSAFLAGRKYQSWYPVAEDLGGEDGEPLFSLFSGGREYTLLLEWYGADGNLLENGREYVKVTRELGEGVAKVQVGERTYATVEEALEAVATTGGTVNLLVDEATVDSLSLTIAGNVKIKGTGTIDVTVKDVEGAEGKHTSVFTIQNTGSLTLDGVKMVVNGVPNETYGSDGTAFTLYGNADGVGSEVIVQNGGELDLRDLNKGFIMGGPAPSTAKVTVKESGVLNASGIDGNFSNGGEFVFDHATVDIEAGVDKVSNYVGHALSVHKLTATASKITASASKYGLFTTDKDGEGEVKLLEGTVLEVKDSGSKLEDGKAAMTMAGGASLTVDSTSSLKVTATEESGGNAKLVLDAAGSNSLLGTVEADMTENTVPYIYAVGFKANAADAQATIQELYGAMGAPEDVVARNRRLRRQHHVCALQGHRHRRYLYPDRHRRGRRRGLHRTSDECHQWRRDLLHL